MSRWTFVRHGESVANRDGWISGWVDVPLSPAGREKAAALGRSLAGRRFDRVFTSDLGRAVDTARLLVPGAPILTVPDLREQNLGTWEGLKRADLRADGRFERIMAWRDGPPGGETLYDVARRTIGWFATVPDGGDTLVVAHGACLRATIGWLDGTEPDRIGKWSLHNLELVERHADRATWAARLAALDPIASPSG